MSISTELGSCNKTQTIRTATDKARALLTLDGFADNSSYDFSIVAGKEENEDFVLEVGEIGGDLYLQWQPLESSPPRAPWLTSIRVYSFARAEVTGDEVRLYLPNDSWCENAARDGLFPHVLFEASDLGRPFTVFTFSTPEMQAFVAKHRDEMFQAKPSIWKKIVPTSSPARPAPVVAPRPKK